MKIAHLDSYGTVINVSIESADFKETPTDVIASDLVGIGDKYIGGKFVRPEPVRTTAELLGYANRTATALLEISRRYVTDANDGSINADATPTTISNLQALMLWAQKNPSGIQNWIDNDYNIQSVTGTQILSLAPKVGAYAQEIYSVKLAGVIEKIKSGEIETFAAIESAFN